MRDTPGRRGWVAVLGMLVLTVGSCGTGEPAGEPGSEPGSGLGAGPGANPDAPPAAGSTPSPTASGAARPEWLGTLELPERADGLGEVRDTPAELVDRRFPPPNPQPVEDAFTATIDPVPDAVLARSTWADECPVTRGELRYLTMTFRGFDDRSYTGELIVHREVAEDVAGVFGQLYDARFPIEEMRVVPAEELDAAPTGDGNNTTGFVCRPVTLGESWSQHAYGLAVDINPFHNPYRRGDAVAPELASAYLDRDRDLPGMIQPGDVVAQAFADIGWGWGGQWETLDDWMHFSRSGR